MTRAKSRSAASSTASCGGSGGALPQGLALPPPKKQPHGIGANEQPLTNLVFVRKVVGLVVKEVVQPPRVFAAGAVRPVGYTGVGPTPELTRLLLAPLGVQK